MQRAKKNYLIYAVMLLLFGALIYMAIEEGDRFSHHAVASSTVAEDTPFTMFCQFVTDNLHHPLSILLIQIIAVLLMVRLFGFLFKHIGQPGVIGEIVAGIVLGPSVLGYFFPDVFQALFPPESLTNLELLSQVGLVLFMFVIGMELDFSVLKNKINETLVISHAGILVPFFLGIVASYWIYEEYAAAQTAFLPFALFIGISMSITAFPVLARIIQERNMTKTSLGTLAIASAANDDVTAWCLLAVVIAIAKAGTFASALYAIGLTALYIIIMFMVVRPFLKKVGEVYANQEVINKTFVALILLILIISSTLTEIIGIHALFGAFMAGVVMPPSIGFRKVMMEKVEDIALVFFLPLFFAFTGLRTEIGLINSPALWGVCLLLMLLFYLYTRYVSGKIAVVEKKTAEAALQAETDNIAKERLKSEISHDIRTPLNVVVGFAELLTGKEELDKETKREYGQMIQTNAESLLNYVNSILELSRLESGKIQYEDEECDIIQLCSEVLDKVNGREESTVSVSLQTDLKEQFARTDRRWFDTLLVSMLTPSENDTARYEAIIRIRRDRSKPLLYFDVVNAPFAKVHFENKTSLIRHEINAHFIHYFGGIYKVQTEAEEGPTISFTIPCRD